MRTEDQRKLAILIWMALAACETEAPPAFTEVDSAGITIAISSEPLLTASEQWLIDPTPAVEFSRDSHGSDMTWVRVQDMTRLPDGQVAVADAGTNQIHLFTESGEHLKSVGQSGDGPGDFRTLRSLGLLSDSLVAFDFSLGRLTVFNEKLEVARTANLPGTPRVREVHMLKDGSAVLVPIFPTLLHYSGPGNELVRGTILLVRVSAEGELLDTITDIAGAEEFILLNESGGFDAGPSLFGQDSHVATGAGVVIAGDGSEMAFEVYRPDGTLVRRVRVDPFHDLRLADEAIEREITAFTGPEPESERARRWQQYFSEYPIPERRPAYGYLLVDELGFVWAREQLGLSEMNGAADWEVFSPEGRWIGSVSLPARFQLMEVGENHVLGVRRDALDVEHPQMLRLSRQGTEG